MSAPLGHKKSPTVQHLKSYDQAMCEATLGPTPSRPSPTMTPNTAVDVGTKADPLSTSPGATISRLEHHHPPEDIKRSLMTFEDPLGLGLETLPTTGHADKMVKRGERKIKLGSLLHSDRLQQQGQTLLVKAELVRAHAIDLPAGEKQLTGQKKDSLV